MSNRSWQNNFKNKQSGFSLIEVLVALIVFTFLVVGVLSMTTVQINSNSYLQHHSKALQLAENGIELLNRVDYNTQLPTYINKVETAIPNFMGYQREYSVQWDTDISTLSVRVFWQKSGRNSNPIVLNSIRTR